MLVFASNCSSVLAQISGPNLFTYFEQSNLAGKVIIGALAFFSLIAWTIMIGKSIELRRMRTFNRGFEEKLREQRTIIDLPDGFRVPTSVAYAAMFRDAVEAYWRVEPRRGESDERLSTARVEHTENALQRAVANQTLIYESNMVFLATIVSSAAEGQPGKPSRVEITPSFTTPLPTSASSSQ